MAWKEVAWRLGERMLWGGVGAAAGVEYMGIAGAGLAGAACVLLALFAMARNMAADGYEAKE